MLFEAVFICSHYLTGFISHAYTFINVYCLTALVFSRKVWSDGIIRIVVQLCFTRIISLYIYINYFLKTVHINYLLKLYSFNATLMLETLRGKRMMFVGDSLNRGQYISMVCLLHRLIPENAKSMETFDALTVFTAKVTFIYNAF